MGESVHGGCRLCTVNDSSSRAIPVSLDVFEDVRIVEIHASIHAGKSFDKRLTLETRRGDVVSQATQYGFDSRRALIAAPQ